VRAELQFPLTPAPKDLERLQHYTTALAYTVGQLMQRLEQLLNGTLTFGDGVLSDNILGKFITYTTNPGGAEDVVVHNLGVIPVGFLLVRPPPNGVVNLGPSLWTTSTISLTCTGASQVVTIFVLSPPRQI